MPSPTPAGYSDVESIGKFLELDQSPPSSSDQQLIADIADNLREEFERFIRWDPAYQVRTELYPGKRQNLCLHSFPYDSTQPVEVRMDVYRLFGDDTIVDPTGYQILVNRAGKELTTWLWFNFTPFTRTFPGPGGWSDPARVLTAGVDELKDTVQIKYTAGYEPGNFPGDYIRVFNTELKTEWLRRKSPHVGSIAVAGNNISVQQPWGASKETIRVLTRYRYENPFF